MFLEAKMQLIHKLLIVRIRFRCEEKTDGSNFVSEFVQRDGLRLRVDLFDAIRISGRRRSMGFVVQNDFPQRSDEFRSRLRDDAGRFDSLRTDRSLRSGSVSRQKRTKETVLVPVFTVDVVHLSKTFDRSKRRTAERTRSSTESVHDPNET